MFCFISCWEQNQEAHGPHQPLEQQFFNHSISKFLNKKLILTFYNTLNLNTKKPTFFDIISKDLGCIKWPILYSSIYQKLQNCKINYKYLWKVKEGHCDLDNLCKKYKLLNLRLFFLFCKIFHIENHIYLSKQRLSIQG